MKPGNARLLVAVLLGLSVTPAAAQDELLNLSLEELLQLPVTAVSGYTTTVADAPATAAVITAEQWQALGAKTVFDVLRYVPGLHVQPSSGGFLLQLVASRGITSYTNSEVLWLLDGLPLAHLNGNRPPHTFDKSLANLRRIEVVKGPGSVIYGANAFSTVINLISRESGGRDGRTGVRAGSNQLREAYAELAGQQGDWSGRLSASQLQRSDDPDRIVSRDAQSALDARFGTQASLAPGPLPDGTAIQELLLRLRHDQTSLDAWHWRHGGPGGGLGPPQALDTERYSGSDFTNLRLQQRWPVLIRASELQLETTWTQRTAREHYRLFPPGAELPIGADGNVNFVSPTTLTLFTDGMLAEHGSRSERRSLQLTLLSRAFAKHVLRASVGREWHRLDDIRYRSNFGPGVLTGNETSVDGTLTDLTGTPFSFVVPRRRQIRFLALQDDLRPTGALLISLGLRHDHYSDFGTSTNPRLSLRWQLQPGTDLRTSYGTAFRAPSFYEQGLRNSPALLGNPKLQPETIRTGEVALATLIRPEWRLEITLFHYRAEHLVQYAPLPPQPGLYAQNLSSREGKGGEALLQWQPRPHWQLNAATSVVDAREEATGAKLANVPRQQYTLTGWYQWREHWTVGWAGKRVAHRVRGTGDGRPPVKDYGTLDLNLGVHELLPGLRLNVAVHNLTDQRAKEPADPQIVDDLPIPGRAAWLGVEWQWR